MNEPLVTVICLCYNHALYLKECIDSVVGQTYGSIEIIMIDDGSTDDSALVMDKILSDYPKIQCIKLPENIGNCAAFNRGLEISKGKYIIDLATDDILYKDRIEKQVGFFQSLDERYGVIFSNSAYVDENGEFIKYHYEIDSTGRTIQTIPQGDIFSELIETYFISTPSMMFKREVLEVLGGYDESLAYEDYDFWIRSSRLFRYAYQDEVLTKVRRLKNSFSSRWYIPGDPQLESTFIICGKIVGLIENDKEKKALINRIKYEIRQSVFSENFREADMFLKMLAELDEVNAFYKLLRAISRYRIRFSFLRNLYMKLRYA
ncbi:glycosyltransferase [Fulvivirgaceae bacterium BMA10]|uniref:Glycosyltransferase n=1 Tax=Splendidivirga corallicola TaxID=3051826 RepID=A0ABT8KRL5_9BACT|nr:glycosyltransferase [Fulvivirgaceae bacterium BMA10]